MRRGCGQQHIALNAPVCGEASAEIIGKSHRRTQQQAFESAGDVAGRLPEQQQEGVVAEQFAESAHEQTAHCTAHEPLMGPFREPYEFGYLMVDPAKIDR